MFKLEFSNTARKELARVYNSDRKLFTRLSAVLESLRSNPYQGKKLKGQFQGDFSVRVGDYRIVYTIYKERLVVSVIDLDHRKDIYR